MFSKRVKQRQQGYYDAVYRNSGIQGYWLIKNSDEVSQVVSEVNQRGQVSSIKTYDFSTLYTNLPHKELKERIPNLVKESFEGLGKKYISVDRHNNSLWTKNKRRSCLLLSCGCWGHAPLPPWQCLHPGRWEGISAVCRYTYGDKLRPTLSWTSFAWLRM